MIHRLDEIVGIYYRFGQFRKRGKSAYLQVYLKSGKPMNIILPSPSLILALRKAVPSVRIKVEWVVRLVVCLLIGLSVGGLMSLMLLMQ